MKQSGFTLIEVLVTIILVGVLSAIALPSYLSYVSRARESEAKSFVGSMNRAQAAHYSEMGRFVIDDAKIPELGLGIKETDNYSYHVSTNRGDRIRSVVNVAESKSDDLHSFLGGVALVHTSADTKDLQSVLCQANSYGKTALDISNLQAVEGDTNSNGSVECGNQLKAVR